jgi:MYXO-CTERM domain-containing protein
VRALNGLLAAALLLAAPAALGNATIVITNGDGPGVGFNDPTPVTPVGGNTGTTLGAQRLIIFQTAATLWGQNLDSPAPISVIAHFQPLACDANGAVLGSAGPTNFFSSDDPTLDAGVPASIFPHPQTWYVSALTSRFAGKAILSGTGTDPNNYDILARFNSALDSAACGSQTWYYGLDDQHGNAIDLLTVVLHEFGHGLGFLSLVTLSDGSFPAMNEPDIWAYFLYDESSGKHWKDMTASQRVSSAVSGALSWDGPSVISAVPNTLSFPVVLRATSAPQTPSVVKEYQYSTAQFGGQPGATSLSGALAVGSTGWGCSAQGKLDPMTGKFALLDRGGPDGGTPCSFVEKAQNAQDAGAIAVLIANNVASPPLAGMAGTAPDVTIPVLGITQADGAALKTAVGAGAVNMSLARETTHRAGADSANRALMYAPPTLETGSSVSHWDKSAFPNLLMEPVINSDLTHNLDLTVPLLKDIGWAEPTKPATKDSGCTTGMGPPAPWLALLGLGALVRRKRRA